MRIAAFIKQRKLEDKTEKDIPQISEFGFAAWEFLTAIYEVDWDKLPVNKSQRSFRQCVSTQFNKMPTKPTNNSNQSNMPEEKQANISKILPPIPPRPSMNVLAKSKYFKNQSSPKKSQSNNLSYIQAFKADIKNIVKIKDVFPKLSANSLGDL